MRSTPTKWTTTRSTPTRSTSQEINFPQGQLLPDQLLIKMWQCLRGQEVYHFNEVFHFEETRHFRHNLVFNHCHISIIKVELELCILLCLHIKLYWIDFVGVNLVGVDLVGSWSGGSWPRGSWSGGSWPRGSWFRGTWSRGRTPFLSCCQGV